MGSGPVFIGGLDRSGKTTLRGFLQSHPSFSIPAVGSNLWTYFYNQYGNLRNPRNFERCLTDMLRYKQIRFLAPDPDRLRKEFQQGPPTYGRLFELLQQQHAEREGKPRWGDQTGLIERYADQVFAAYPDAKMIHMIRDPRDRYAGSLQLWPDGKGRAGGAAARWSYSTRLAERNLKKYPQRYFILRFEDMVTEPEKILQAVCAFLGEGYDPGMLSMNGAPEHRDKMIRRSHGDQAGSPLSTAYLGIFRDQIPAGELAFLQYVLRHRLQTHSYPLEQVQLTGRQRTEFLAKTLPLNLARMAAWFAMEAGQQLLPSIFRRKPSAHMRVEPSSQPFTIIEGER